MTTIYQPRMGCFSCFTIRVRQAADGGHAQEFLGKPESIEEATPPPKISTCIPEEVGSVANVIEGLGIWCKIEHPYSRYHFTWNGLSAYFCLLMPL